MNPDLHDFSPRIGFAFAARRIQSIRGGFGTGYVHYTRAGSGDILAINAPQAQFAAVTQISRARQTIAARLCPRRSSRLAPPRPAATSPPTRDSPPAGHHLQSGHRQHHLGSEGHAATATSRTTSSSVQQQLAKNTLLDIAYVGNHGLHLEGFLNANQKNPHRSDLTRPLRQLAQRHHRSAQRVLLQLQLAAGSL